MAMPTGIHLDRKPIQLAIAAILLIAAIGLPGYLVLSPQTSFSEASAPR
jgi:hypothetical protein